MKEYPSIPRATAKAKTQKWVDRVLEIHGATGQRLIES